MMYTREKQKTNRQKWVEALRSGNYKQGQKRLHTDDGFCCLGVACDISGLGEWKESCYDTNDVNVIPSFVKLSNEVMDWLGAITHECSIFMVDEEDVIAINFLTNLNDSDWTFEQIADIIELGYLEIV